MQVKTFIDWCKPINNIELTTIEGEGVNEINRIVDEVKKTKDELQWVWIMNYNMKATFKSVKLLLVCNLVYVILLFLTMILFIIFKWNE